MPADDARLDAWIVGQMAEAVISCDRGGVISRWNDAAVSVFGFSAAEALGQGLDLIIPERLRAAHWKGFDAAVARGQTRLMGRATVTRALHKSGGKCYVEMSFALLRDDGGAVVGAVAVARDVTGRVERERQASTPPSAPRPA